jgi:hypothetical protein
MKTIKAKIIGVENNAGTGQLVYYLEPYPDIDLTDRKLGEQLVKDARGKLPIEVWDKYLFQHLLQHDGRIREVVSWCVDADDPDSVPIDPRQAVEQALPLLNETIEQLGSNDPRAVVAAQQARAVLFQSRHKRGRGVAPTAMHRQAVRAWVIRNFNPLPKKPTESTVGWARLADLLFLEDGKCPRKIDSVGTIVRREPCGLAEHRYDSPCVKALMTAVGNLKSAMKRDGIPTEPFVPNKNRRISLT